jgi:hypothetical protein
MDHDLVNILLGLRNLSVATFVLVAGLFGYAVYATVTIARIQRSIFQGLRDLRGRQS